MTQNLTGAPSDNPESNEVIGETRSELMALRDKVLQETGLSTLFSDIRSTINELAALPMIGWIFKKLQTEEDRNAAAAQLAAAAQGQSSDRAPGQSQAADRIVLPPNLPTATPLVSTSGWYLLADQGRTQEVYIEVDLGNSSEASRNVRIPKADMQDLINQGYRLNSGQTVKDFISMQLLSSVNIGGSTVQFHKDHAAKLNRVFQQIQQEGITYPISNSGTFVFRNKRGGNNNTDKSTISKHGLGMAIDINASHNEYQAGKSVTLNGTTLTGDTSITDIPARVVQIFEENGFYWGGNFGDPMHFEIRT